MNFEYTNPRTEPQRRKRADVRLPNRSSSISTLGKPTSMAYSSCQPLLEYQFATRS